MRTYQRMVISKHNKDVSYPHNFLVYDTNACTLAVGETGVRYTDLPRIILGQMTGNESSLDAPSSLSTIRSLGGVSSSPT